MKKLFAILFAVAISGTASAVDPTFQGTFYDAMQETDAAARAVKLVDALEISANSGPIDNNAMRMLELELKNNNPAIAELIPRLLTLLDKNPGNFNLAGFCFSAAVKYNKLTPELFTVFEKCLASADLSALPREQFTNLAHILKICANSLLSEGEINRAVAMIDAVLAKKNDNLSLLQLEAQLIIRACFIVHNTAPGINGYNELAADNPWKVRLQNISAKLLNTSAANADDAEILLNTANELRLAQTPELLRQYAERFPTHDWSIVSALIAANCRQPDLFIPGSNQFVNLIAALHCKNFTKAESIIAALPENIRPSLLLMLNSAKGEHQLVTQAFAAGDMNIRDLSLLATDFVINSAFIQKDTVLIRNILNLVYQGHEADAIENLSLCNSIGYVASVFNIELSKAEVLIRAAVASDPHNSSYLDSLAWVLFRQGKKDEAENMITQALKYREASAAMCVIYLHAAEIKAAQHKFGEAKILLNKAKQLYDPDDDNCSEYSLQTERRLERLLK